MIGKQLKNRIKPPCGRCLYKRGLVQTLTNPCPQCKANGYSMCEQFEKNASRIAADTK